MRKFAYQIAGITIVVTAEFRGEAIMKIEKLLDKKFYVDEKGRNIDETLIELHNVNLHIKI